MGGAPGGRGREHLVEGVEGDPGEERLRPPGEGVARGPEGEAPGGCDRWGLHLPVVTQGLAGAQYVNTYMYVYISASNSSVFYEIIAANTENKIENMEKNCECCLCVSCDFI